MKKLALLILIGLGFQSSLQAQQLSPRRLTPNGRITDMARKGDTLFAVGSFREVGYHTGGAALIHQNQGAMLNFPIVDGEVFAVEPDGLGGWYLGGMFTQSDTFTRINLVHVLPNGETDPAFDIPVNHEIFALEKKGPILYLGGKFTQVAGQSRNYIAAIDLSSNSLSPWNPDANNQVETLMAWNDTMMVGGWFSQIGGVYQPGFAALDVVTGLAIQTPAPGNGWVHTLEVAGDKLYLGGTFLGNAGYFTDRAAQFGLSSPAPELPDFHFPRLGGNVFAVVEDGQGGWYLGGGFIQVNGQSAARLVHILPDMSVDTAFLPAPNNLVYALARKGDTLYVGGTFSSIAGQSRANLAAFDLSSHTLLNWQPEPNNRVNTLALVGDKLIVGGIFTRIGNEQHPRLAVVDLNAGIPLSTKAPVSGEVKSLAYTPSDGGHLFVGGSFNGDVGFPAQKAAFFAGMAEHSPSDFPEFNNAVRAAVPDGAGGMYVAGQFSQVNGATQRRLAHILPDYSIDPNFEFNINNSIYTMDRVGNTLYIGGLFTSIDGNARNRVAAIDISSNTLSSWNPDVNNQVNVLVPDGGTVLIGGKFTSVGGQTRNRLASIDATTGLVTAWNPDANNEVIELLIQGNDVFIGGTFTLIGGNSRNRLAKVDKSSGALAAWDPNLNNAVRSLEYGGGNTLYVGGSFTQTNGNTVPRNRLAAIDMSTGTTLSGFDPNLNNAVWDIALFNDTMMLAGQFTQVGGVGRNRIAALTASTGALLPWQPELNGTAYTMLPINGSLLVGGAFSATQVETRNRLMDYSPGTFELQAFAPLVNNRVNAVVVRQNELLLGGTFTQVAGQARSYVARYDYVTDNLASWNPGADAAVNAILSWNDTMMVAGDFETLSGTSRPGLGLFSLSSGNLLNWNPKASGDVLALARQGTQVVAGGEFTHFDAEVRNRMLSIDLPNGKLTGWNPDLPGLFGGPRIKALAVSGDSVWVGGKFGTIGGQTRSNLALTDAQTGQILAADLPVDDEIFDLKLFNDTMMVIMGRFQQVDGQQRRHGAAIDVRTATLHPFAPEMDFYGQTVAWNDTIMVLGGDFSHVFSTTRHSGYALNTLTGELLDWHPEVGQNQFITSLLMDPNQTHIYLGGTFQSIRGEAHQGLAKVDLGLGIPDSTWNASANQFVTDMEWDAERELLYVVGNFWQLNGQARNHIGALDPFGNLSAFDPSPDQNVYQIELLDSTILVAGAFSQIGGEARDRLAQLDLDGQATAWAPDVNFGAGAAGQVNALEVSTDRIYIGGFFQEVNGEERHRLAAFNLDGILLPWAPPVNRSSGTALFRVEKIRAVNDHLFLMGSMSEIAGTSVSNFAWLDAPSGLVRGMRIVPNSFLESIQVMDSLIYLGGSFTTINQENHFNIAEFAFPNGFFADGFSDIIPNKGGNTGDLTANIYGAGFDLDVQVLLRKDGFDDIVGFDSLTAVLSGLQVRTTFDLRNQPPGFRDVWLISPGDTTIIPGGFEVTEGGQAEPWADVLMPAAIRFLNFMNGGEHNIYITYGNSGEIDAEGVPIWFAVDTALEVIDFNFDWIPLPDSAIDPNDSVFYAVQVDTIAGIHFPAHVYCIVLPRVPAGFQGQLGVKVKPTRTGDVWVDAWATAPLYGSPLKHFMPSCVDALLGKLIGFVPGGDCIYNAMDALFSPMFDAAYDPNFASAQWGANYVFTLTKALVSCGILVTGGGLVLDMLSDLLKLKDLADDIQALIDCIEMAPKPTPDRLPVLNSTDPNQKSGPRGINAPNWVNKAEPMTYLVEFENVDSATAPAIQVVILDTLDASVYDVSSLELNFFTIADSFYRIPRGQRSWTSYVDLNPRINTLVEVKAELLGNVLRWQFTSLDPQTLEPQLGVTDGFLPPNVNDPEGRGSISYTLSRWDNLPTLTTVSNRAAIYFDSNAPILTNTWTNTLDTDLPTSAVATLPDTTNSLEIPISWTSDDVGSGVRHVNVYVSEDSDPYQLIAARKNATDSLVYMATPGHSYRFYSQATDSIWNVELTPGIPDARTHIPSALSVDQPLAAFHTRVYPNPNAGSFVLEIEAPGTSGLSVALIDLLGNTIEQRQSRLVGGKQTLSFQQPLPAGVYALRIRTKWGEQVKLVEIGKR